MKVVKSKGIIVVAVIIIIGISGLAAASLHLSSKVRDDLIPLSLSLSARVAASDEGLTLVLRNTLGQRIFVPGAWGGLAIYRLEPGSWQEHYYPSPYQPMIHTTDQEISYELPGGTLDPGHYKLVLHGRIGKDGQTFALETVLEICEYRLLKVDLVWELGQPLAVIITNNRLESVSFEGENLGITLLYKQGKSWEIIAIDSRPLADLPRQLESGQSLIIPVIRVPQKGQFEVIVDGIDSLGNHVRGQATLVIDEL